MFQEVWDLRAMHAAMLPQIVSEAGRVILSIAEDTAAIITFALPQAGLNARLRTTARESARTTVTVTVLNGYPAQDPEMYAETLTDVMFATVQGIALALQHVRLAAAVIIVLVGVVMIRMIITAAELLYVKAVWDTNTNMRKAGDLNQALLTAVVMIYMKII